MIWPRFPLRLPMMATGFPTSQLEKRRIHVRIRNAMRFPLRQREGPYMTGRCGLERQHTLHRRHATPADAWRSDLAAAHLGVAVEQGRTAHLDALAGFEMEVAVGSEVELRQQGRERRCRAAGGRIFADTIVGR